MDISAILRGSLLNLGALAKLAGLSRDQLKKLAAPGHPRMAGEDTRRAIAHALRGHAAQLMADADRIDPDQNGGSGPSGS